MERLQHIVAPHYAWVQDEIVPEFVKVWLRLDVPAWDIYREAARTCGKDLLQSSQSTLRLLYLTLRPVVILFWILGEVFWQIGKILFRHLLEKGWISLKKGVLQAKAGVIWFYKFQRSLSRTEVLMEVGIIVTCVLLYYLRQWLKRQTYVARATKWCRQKKRRVIQVYTKTLHKVAQVSLLLAMTLPHLAFLGAGLGLRIVFPSLVKWLAYDTYATAIISIWYPLIYTLGWIHQDRYQQQPEKKPENDATIQKPTPGSPRAKKNNVKTMSARIEKGTSSRSKQKQRNQPSYLKATASQQARERFTKKRSAPLSSRVFPATSPQPKDKTEPSSQRVVLPPLPPESGTKYWLRYWIVFAVIQAFGNTCYLIPVLGRFVAHPFMLSAAAELKLLFFVWMFGMEKLLGNTAAEGDAVLAEALPMRLLDRHLTPLLLDLDTTISEVVSQEKWQTTVHSKAQRVLDVFVMVRFISEPFKDWLLHIIEEGRVLLLPSITLLMPGFVTQFGVAYVQFVVPSAKSARVNNETTRVLYLQYWVLHCVLSFFFSWTSSILWWFPLSTHAIFLAWCHLSFPQTIKEYYAILDMELVAFGLIKGEKKLDFQETRTVRLLAAVAKRLPKAADPVDDDDGEDEDDTVAAEKPLIGDIDPVPSAESEEQQPNADAMAVEENGTDEAKRVVLESEKLKASSADTAEEDLGQSSMDTGESVGGTSLQQANPIASEDGEEAVQVDATENGVELSPSKDSYPGLESKTLPTYESDSSASQRSEEASQASSSSGQDQGVRRSTRSRKPVNYNEEIYSL